MQFTLAYASANFEELLALAHKGEEVEIARDGKVIAKLVVEQPVKIQESHAAEEHKHRSDAHEGEQEERAAE